MEFASIIVIIIMAVSFACAVVFIAKNGGWKGEGCGGHCATCNHHCADPATMQEKLAAQQTATNEETMQATDITKHKNAAE